MQITYLIVAFGEMEISPLTIGVLIALTSLTFIAVGISSLKLLRFGSDED